MKTGPDPNAPPDAQRFHAAILDLLARRREGGTICPSEAARLACPGRWREAMEATRAAALALQLEGRVEICQGGVALPPSTPWRGPIRIRLRARS